MRETGFVPSVPETTVEERIYAHGWIKDSVEHRWPIEDMPEDVREIFVRGDQVRHERALFLRDDTTEIPEKLLRPGESITLVDIVRMLHVYFWWEEGMLTPADYIEDLLQDLDDERFIEAVNLLHATFPSYCETPHRTEKAKANGYGCLKRYAKEMETIKGKAEQTLSDRRKRGQLAAEWLSEIVMFEDEGPLEDNDEYDEPSLNTVTRTIGKLILAEAGADHVEVAYLDQVLDQETHRRFPGYQNRDAYAAYRDTGQSFEDAMREYFPAKTIDNPPQLKHMLESFEDLPTDAANWDREKLLALARRHVESLRDWYELYEVSYQWNEFGQLPTYVIAMAESHFPAELRT